MRMFIPHGSNTASRKLSAAERNFYKLFVSYSGALKVLGAGMKRPEHG